jgi:hypothetical protein
MLDVLLGASQSRCGVLFYNPEARRIMIDKYQLLCRDFGHQTPRIKDLRRLLTAVSSNLRGGVDFVPSHSSRVHVSC